jgi:hypothetical protein
MATAIMAGIIVTIATGTGNPASMKSPLQAGFFIAG